MSEDFEFVERSIEDSVRVPDPDENVRFSFRTLWAYTGPGFLICIAFLDPGNIESDLQQGAATKYKLLWLLFWSTVVGLYLQVLSARLGTVTGLHMATICRREYPYIPRTILWILVEMAIVSADIQEVIGSAIAINLLTYNFVPIWLGVILTGLDTFTFLLLESYGLRKLEALFGAFVTIMVITFWYMCFAASPNILLMLKGTIVPWCSNCHSSDAVQGLGIIGSVIMPHNLYLHSALVLSRKVDRNRRKNVKEANFYFAIESSIALFISFLINIAIVAVFANAANDKDATLQRASIWIREHYGEFVVILWGIGLLASGQSSTMTGTYVGQFVMEGFLGISWPKWRRVLFTRTIAITPTIFVALFALQSLNELSELLNVLQSCLLPFAIIPLLVFTSKRRIMGEFVNNWFNKALSYTLCIVLIGINIFSVYISMKSLHLSVFLVVLIEIFTFIYTFFILYIMFGVEPWAHWLHSCFPRYFGRPGIRLVYT